MRLRPSATLFPYTTLFRSEAERRRGQVHPGQQPAAGDLRGPVGDVADGDDPVGRRGGGVHVAGGDRKSTRLNSSHSSISYAVFCLKKKIDHLDGIDQRSHL